MTVLVIVLMAGLGLIIAWAFWDYERNLYAYYDVLASLRNPDQQITDPTRGSENTGNSDE